MGLLTLPLLLSVGCELIGGYKDSNIDNGYNLFVLKKGIGHFSFEYLTKYNLDIVETRTDEYHYTNVSFHGWAKKKNVQFTSISVFIDGDKDVASPEDMANHDLSFWSKESEYNLIDLSTINVSGISGRQSYFSYFMPAVQPAEGRFTPACRWLNKSVYFDHGGVIWKIHIQSPLLEEQSEIQDFDHIIQTFKVLD